jgi:glycolate oxidase FAD binding subunit
MPQILKPRDAKDVQDAVAWALSEGVAIEIVGHGSKRSIGRLSPTDIVLDLSALRGITLYESNELVFSAQAGTPIVEIAETLARENQQLAFEVPDYGPLLGGADGRGTIGGLIAANLSGPRRIKAGALRDHFLGVSAVSGRGELFKSGGRVIKNVTGYDLCKLLAGSWGTLAVMTEVTLKVLPRAETETTLLLRGLSDAKAAAAMAAAMASMGDVSGAAHLPARMAARSAALDGDGQAVTALRLEGIAAAMAQRKRLLDAALASFGAVAELGERASRALWREIRDVQPLAAAAASERALWRVSTAPAQGHKAAAAIAADGEAEFFYDWAGGLLWIALPAAQDGGAARVRQAVAGVGGHAMLFRAPEAVRARIDAFEPQDAVAAALTRQVKLAFDPKGVLNPGRMYAGV